MTAGRRKARQRTKDKVLQARIPEDLDTELRGRAEQLGLSVSTVVRNVLLNTFDLVEDVVADSALLARSLNTQTTPQAAKAPEASKIVEMTADAGATATLGWQELTLNRNAICEECNTILARGEQAAVGVPISPRPIFLCKPCLEALSTETTGTTDSTTLPSSNKTGSRAKPRDHSSVKSSTTKTATLKRKPRQ